MSEGKIGARFIIWQNHFIGFWCFPSFGLLYNWVHFHLSHLVETDKRRDPQYFTTPPSFTSYINLCACAKPEPLIPVVSMRLLVQRGPCVLKHEYSAFPSDCWVDVQRKLIAERTWHFCGSFCSLTLVRRDMGEDEDKKNWEAGIDKSLKVPGQVGGRGESLEYLWQKLTFKTIYKTEFIHS